MSTNATVEVLDVSPSERRLRVRIRVTHPDANPPLDRGYFVRMLGTLARAIGGNGAIESALPDPLDDWFVDANVWRFVETYTEAPENTRDDGVYEVTVVDGAWLEGLTVGLVCDSADYSVCADHVTAAEAAVLPDVRRGRVLRPFETLEYGGLAVSSSGRFLALLSDSPRGLAVFETDSLTEVYRAEDVPRADGLAFVPGTDVLLIDSAAPAVDVATGAELDRRAALGAWQPTGGWEGLLWACASADGALRVVQRDRDLTTGLMDGAGRLLGQRPWVGEEPLVSRDGTVLVAYEGATLQVCDTRSERPARVLPLRDPCGYFALSPDGAYALTIEGRYRHVYLRRLSDGAVMRYGNSWHDRGSVDPHSPVWSPDGAFIALCYYDKARHDRARVEVCSLAE